MASDEDPSQLKMAQPESDQFEQAVKTQIVSEKNKEAPRVYRESSSTRMLLTLETAPERDLTTVANAHDHLNELMNDLNRLLSNDSPSYLPISDYRQMLVLSDSLANGAGLGFLHDAKELVGKNLSNFGKEQRNVLSGIRSWFEGAASPFSGKELRQTRASIGEETDQKVLKTAFRGLKIEDLVKLYAAYCSTFVWQYTMDIGLLREWRSKLMSTRDQRNTRARKADLIPTDCWEGKLPPSRTFPSTQGGCCSVKKCPQSFDMVTKANPNQYQALRELKGRIDDLVRAQGEFTAEVADLKLIDLLPTANDLVHCTECGRSYCLDCLSKATMPPVWTPVSFGALQLAFRQMESARPCGPLVNDGKRIPAHWSCPCCLTVGDDSTQGHVISLYHQLVQKEMLQMGEDGAPDPQDLIYSEEYLGSPTPHLAGAFVYRTGFMDVTEWTGGRSPVLPVDSVLSKMYDTRNKRRAQRALLEKQEAKTEAQVKTDQAGAGRGTGGMIAELVKDEDDWEPSDDMFQDCLDRDEVYDAVKEEEKNQEMSRRLGERAEQELGSASRIDPSDAAVSESAEALEQSVRTAADERMQRERGARPGESRVAQLERVIQAAREEMTKMEVHHHKRWLGNITRRPVADQDRFAKLMADWNGYIEQLKESLKKANSKASSNQVAPVKEEASKEAKVRHAGNSAGDEGNAKKEDKPTLDGPPSAAGPPTQPSATGDPTGDGPAGDSDDERPPGDPGSWDWSLPKDKVVELGSRGKNYFERLVGKKGLLPCFDGSDILLYPGWASEFHTRVHRRNDLTATEKMDCLRQALSGDALAKVKSILVVGAPNGIRKAYPEALQTLAKAYPTPLLRFRYLQKFNELSSVPDNDILGLQLLLNSLREIYDGMQALGEPAASMDVRVVEVIPKLPPRLVTDRNSTLAVMAGIRAKSGFPHNASFPGYLTISQEPFRDVLEYIQEFLSTAAMTNHAHHLLKTPSTSSFQASAVSPGAQEGQQTSIFISGNGSSNQEPVSAKRAMSKKPFKGPGRQGGNWKCKYCNGPHQIWECFEFPAKERWAVVRNKGWCERCLGFPHVQPNHCRYFTKECTPCRNAGTPGALHHPTLCQNWLNEKTKTAAKISTMAVGLKKNTLPEDEEEIPIEIRGKQLTLPNTRQAMIQGKVYHPSGRVYEAKFCSDPGSQLSFMSRSLADRVGLKPEGFAYLILSTAGTSDSQYHTVFKYSFPIRLSDLPHREKWFEAWSLRVPCGNVHLQQIELPEHLRKELSGKVMDWEGMQTSGEFPVDVLVGLDQLDAVFTNPTQVAPGIRCYDTPWGATLAGKFPGPRPGEPGNVRTSSTEASVVQSLEKKAESLPGVVRATAYPTGAARQHELRWITSWEDDFQREPDPMFEDDAVRELMNLMVESIKSVDTLGLGESKLESPGDDEIWNRYVAGCKFDPKQQKYVVCPPVKPSEIAEGVDSHLNVCLATLGRLLRRPKEVKRHFEAIFEELIRDKHLIKVDGQGGGGLPRRYIPYFVVEKLSSSSTPYRLVLNAASKDASGRSYNSFYEPGPNLTSNLFELLLRFRLAEEVVIADVRKAFHQVKVAASHRRMNSLVLPRSWDQTEPRPFDVYEMSGLPMGATFSPMGLAAVIHLHMTQLNNHPQKPIGMTKEMLDQLAKDTYVDNVFLPFKSEQALEVPVRRLEFAFETGGFPLTQFASSKPGLDKILPADKIVADDRCAFLGVKWTPSDDTIGIKKPDLPSEIGNKFTKRHLLALQATPFDPYGFIGPVTTRARLLCHKVFSEMKKSSWNTPVPEEYLPECRKLLKEFLQYHVVSVPRRVMDRVDKPCWLVCVSDASAAAMGAVIFLCQEGTAKFLLGKPKILPTDDKRMTVPRAEFSAVCFGSELLAKVEKVVDGMYPGLRRPSRIVTDSQNAFFWGTSERPSPNIWHTHRRRKLDFNLHSQGLIWRPREFTHSADLLTQGTSMKKAMEGNYHGAHPLFLEPPEKWVHFIEPSLIKEPAELASLDLPRHQGPKASYASILMAVVRPEILPPLDPSSFTRMETFLNESLRLSLEREGPWSDKERSDEWKRWVRNAQEKFAAEEVLRLKSDPSVHRSQRLDQLNLFFDEEEMIRVGPRVAVTGVQPMLLPREAVGLVELAAREAHWLSSHGALSLTKAKMREIVWVPKVGNVLRRLFGADGSCKECLGARGLRLKRPLFPPLMTAERTKFLAPFTVSGLDHMGPFTLPNDDKKKDPIKVSILLITCASTRAIWLEVVDGVSMEDTWAALEKFFMSWGFPAKLISDNGTGFVTLSRSLEVLVGDHSPDVQQKLLRHGFRWDRYPPTSPQSGGWIERLVGLVKKSLASCLYGQTTLTRNAFVGVVSAICQALNTRPLCQSENPDEPCLTPWMALHPGQQQSLEIAAEAVEEFGHMLEGLPSDCGPKRFHDLIQNRQSILSLFKRDFEDYYLPFLRETQLRREHIQGKLVSKVKVKVGTRYLLANSKRSRSYWPIYRVVEVLPGSDGETRFVRAINEGTNTERVCAVGDLVRFELDADDGEEVVVPDGQKGKKNRQLGGRRRRRAKDPSLKVGAVIDGQPMGNRLAIQTRKEMRQTKAELQRQMALDHQNELAQRKEKQRVEREQRRLNRESFRNAGHDLSSSTSENEDDAEDSQGGR